MPSVSSAGQQGTVVRADPEISARVSRRAFCAGATSAPAVSDLAAPAMAAPVGAFRWGSISPGFTVFVTSYIVAKKLDANHGLKLPAPTLYSSYTTYYNDFVANGSDVIVIDWNRRVGHLARGSSRLAESQEPDLDLGPERELAGLLARRDRHGGVAVRRVGLSSTGDGAARPHRLHPAERVRIPSLDAFVALRDGAGAGASRGRHLERERHVPSLEGAVVDGRAEPGRLDGASPELAAGDRGRERDPVQVGEAPLPARERRRPVGDVGGVHGTRPTRG